VRRPGRLEREPDQQIEVAQVERLRDVGEDAGRVGGGGGLGVAVAGDHDDRDRPIDQADLLEDLEPVHPRHVHVEQHEVRAGAQHREVRVGAVRRGLDRVGVPVTEVPEELLQHLDHGRLIVHDEDPLRAGPGGRHTVSI